MTRQPVARPWRRFRTEHGARSKRRRSERRDRFGAVQGGMLFAARRLRVRRRHGAGAHHTCGSSDRATSKSLRANRLLLRPCPGRTRSRHSLRLSLSRRRSRARGASRFVRPSLPPLASLGRSAVGCRGILGAGDGDALTHPAMRSHAGGSRCVGPPKQTELRLALRGRRPMRVAQGGRARTPERRHCSSCEPGIQLPRGGNPTPTGNDDAFGRDL